MKASQAGNNTVIAKRVLDHFAYVYNWHSYIRAKYDGLFPSNFPTKTDYRNIEEQISHHQAQGDPDGLVPLLYRARGQLDRRVRATQREWMRMQKP